MMNKALSVYKQALVTNFLFLKSAKNIQEAFLRAVPIDNKGFLVPVCEAHQEDLDLLQKLTVWRNANVGVYPSQFIANLESTKSWLRDRLLAVPDRILFLVTNNHGLVIGHIGFNGCLNDDFIFEVENVIRGEIEIEKDIFSHAIKALTEWARKTLNVNGFFLRVMDDNPHAIAFYKRNGFVEETRIPLAKVEKNGQINYRELKSGESKAKDFVRMSYQSIREPGKTMILTAGPSISAREGVYAYDAAMNGWNSNWSKYLTTFEKQFAKFVGAKYAIATSSCTGALQVALMSLDIGPGDEVIVPDETWVATANAVRYVGAIPVFADVELDTWNIDAKSVESLITPRTKAVIAVHMYGHPARMNLILDVARKHGLKVVEDAAPAIGAEWQSQRCGSFGDFAAFSFQGAKLLVTGEGGMLVTNDDSLYQKALKIWDQGRNPSRVFWIDANGVKFKMSNVQAAVGLAQLERADELIEMKRRLFDWYQEGLSDTPLITLNKEVEGARSIYWMSSLFLNEAAQISRDELMVQLKARNIDTRPVFPAISQYPIWPRKQNPQPTALRVGARALNLPSGVCLSKDEVMYVCRSIAELVK
jgi:perosamine synthetase